ncbi:MAG: metallophosphoesterase [Clostridia bacterium]|nr:metallophosphoesterase [Clostridia bacterium]
MRIGVFSDTHGSLSALEMFRKPLGRLDCIFHLGDFASDAGAIASAFCCPSYVVRGNCDYGSSAPCELTVELLGKRFLLTHGHGYWVEHELIQKAVENGCNAIFYGHTHIPSLNACGELLLCNPGSLSRPRGGSKRSCALLTLDDDDLYIKLLSPSSSSL